MIPLLSISQSGYPKKIILNGVPLVAFTEEQTKKIDLYRVDLNSEKSFREYYENKAKSCDSVLEQFVVMNAELKVSVQKYKNLDTMNAELADNNLAEINSLKNDVKTISKKNARNSTLVKILGVSLTASVVLIALIL